MVKFKCKGCGKEHEIEHDKDHKFKKAKAKLKCNKCDTLIDIPTCCNEKMYIAS